MIYLIDMFGIAVFAITGSLAADRKNLDLFGVIVMGLVTALGGGTLRDLILDAPVIWIADPNYILVASAASLITFFFARFLDSRRRFLLLADAFGLAMFSVLGAQKAQSLGVNGVIAVLMGITTGVVGGMIRDVLSGEIPLVMRREIYATAALLGSAVFVLLSRWIESQNIILILAVAVALGLRLAAIKWNLSLPTYEG